MYLLLYVLSPLKRVCFLFPHGHVRFRESHASAIAPSNYPPSSPSRHQEALRSVLGKPWDVLRCSKVDSQRRWKRTLFWPSMRVFFWVAPICCAPRRCKTWKIWRSCARFWNPFVVLWNLAGGITMFSSTFPRRGCKNCGSNSNQLRLRCIKWWAETRSVAWGAFGVSTMQASRYAWNTNTFGRGAICANMTRRNTGRSIGSTARQNSWDRVVLCLVRSRIWKDCWRDGNAVWSLPESMFAFFQVFFTNVNWTPKSCFVLRNSFFPSPFVGVLCQVPGSWATRQETTPDATGREEIAWGKTKGASEADERPELHHGWHFGWRSRSIKSIESRGKIVARTVSIKVITTKTSSQERVTKNSTARVQFQQWMHSYTRWCPPVIN